MTLKSLKFVELPTKTSDPIVKRRQNLVARLLPQAARNDASALL